MNIQLISVSKRYPLTKVQSPNTNKKQIQFGTMTPEIIQTLKKGSKIFVDNNPEVTYELLSGVKKLWNRDIKKFRDGVRVKSVNSRKTYKLYIGELTKSYTKID